MGDALYVVHFALGMTFAHYISIFANLNVFCTIFAIG